MATGTAIAVPTATPTPPATHVSPGVKSTQTGVPATPSPTPQPTRDPANWQDWPVIPTVSARARAIYQKGLALGNNPRAFSKIGDCESTSTWFLSDFDGSPSLYRLGDYTALKGVIDQYAGSWKRNSLAVKPGFTATSVLAPIWADPKQCQKNETPLDCEYRTWRPAIAFIMLGSNDVPRPERFEPRLRQILDRSLALGVLPILVTKADNLETDHAINAAIARLAAEYDLPLWNFWRAVQDLPRAGLQEDLAHLTWAPNRFDDPEAMRAAWPWRNLTALQALDAVSRAVGAD